MSIKIRQATAEDESFILSLIPRLTAFGPPPWRHVHEMTAYDSHIILRSLHDQPEDTIILIAEDEDGTSLGLIHLFEGSDYYFKRRHGHISDLIVADEAEGRGVGKMLLETGEAWAKEKGYSWLTLSVFAQNQRAIDLYQRAGYGADIIKYVKEI